MHREFKGVWIPKELYLLKQLSWIDKLILIEVDSFSSNELECFVSNDHLAEFTQASVSSIEKAVSKLVKAGYLTRTRKKINGKSTRFLLVNSSRFCDKLTINTANNISQNLRTTKYNILKQTTKTKKESKPVNITECIKTFIEVNSTETEAIKFYNYYEANGWKQGNAAKSIKNWKAAANNWIIRAKEYNQKNIANGYDTSKINTDRLKQYIKQGR